jgi:hypothetical protein
VTPTLILGDVTRLGELNVGGGHALLLDLGCFHSIPDERRDAYVAGVSAAAASGATFLLFGFLRSEKGNRFGPRGVLADEVAHRFEAGWEVVTTTPGATMAGLEPAWYRLRRR